MTIVAKLEMKLAELAARLPAPRCSSSRFSVEAFVADLVSNPEKMARTNVELLALQRKVEVARRISAFYTPDMKRREGGEVARPEFALALCALFLTMSARAGDPRSLNAALKMLDGILIEPQIPADPLLSGCAQEIVEQIRIPDAKA